MSYDIVITHSAEIDLEEITFNIADISKNIDIALKFIDELQASLEILKDFPESGSLPLDSMLLNKGYRFKIFKDYLIFYTIDKESKTVFIEKILNGKLDYVKIMRTYL
jgi:toxin ParE1/3/4